MSADLLAEFDNFYKKPEPQSQRQSQSQALSQAGQIPSSQQQNQQQQRPNIVSDDLWNIGSFNANSNNNNNSNFPSQPTQSWAPTQTTQTASQATYGNAWGDFESSSGTTSTAQPQASQAKAAVDDDDDEGWGDFEEADPTAPPAPASIPPQASSATKPLPPTRITRASTFDLMTNSLVDVEEARKEQKQKAAAASGSSGSMLRDVVKQQAQAARPKPPPPPRQSDPNVLFDAEDFDQEAGSGNDDDDDDFGDFETGDGFSSPQHNPPPQPAPQQYSEPKPKPQPQPQQARQTPVPLPSLDLLSLDDSPQPLQPDQPQPKKGSTHLSSLSIASASSIGSQYPQAPRSPSFSQRNPYPGLALKTPTSPNFPKEEEKKVEREKNSPTPLTAWPSFGQASKKGGNKGQDKDASGFNEDWSPFEDLPPEKDSARPADTWDWDAVDTPQTGAQSGPKTAAPAPKANALDPDDTIPPPTNIPPPSVLLSIFPQLLAQANTSLFKPLAAQSASIKDRITSDPSTVTFLRGYLLLASVAARIVAGRKLRWHRDKFLAQGMAISAAGAKGMKLAGVDRAQAAREDREAADVVAAWREIVGRLRSAVAAVKSAAGNEPLRVPELAETMPVTTAKVVPTAPKACLICGLKRDERVAKVDIGVEDSFGEWWVDHWGHRACKNFWLEHEKELRQR